MQELHITVSNKIATYRRRDGYIVCGNSSYMIVFAFDAEWDAYPTKTARFVWNNVYLDVPFTGNTVKVPVLSDTTLLQVGVYAGDLHTTTPARIYCKKSILCGFMVEAPEPGEQPEIPEGYIYPTGTKTITENGSYDISTYATALVEVPTAEYVEPQLQDKLITENGVFTADPGFDGLGRVEVRVVSSTDLPTLMDSIAYTSNGDGTCIVSGIGTFTDKDLVIPAASPFGETVVGIAENAFSGCAGLLSVTIPRSITAIPGGCFSGCAALAELDITDSVVSVGDNAFSGCTSLEAVYYHGDREDYASIDLLEEGNTAFSAATVYYIGTADGLAFSSNGDGTCTVTGIGTCSEKSFAIPSTSPSGDTVVAIGADAFKDDSTLMHVEFPQTLTKIDTYAFYGCKSLRGIVLPAGIKTIGNYAFKGCVGLKEMVLPDSITSLGTHCFNECSGLVSITLPRSVTTIPKNLIADCTSLTRIVVPKEVKTISQWALSGCTALREIIFEEGSQLTKIETYALSKNPNMPELKLPPLLTTTAGYMLDYNTTLARINYPADLAPSDNTFSGLSKLVRCDIEDIVKFCQKNGSAKNRPTQSATNLVYYYDGEPLINFTLPVEVTLLGSYVFYQCKTLKSVVLHDALTTIGACCFSGCTGLGAVTLSRSLTSIGSSAFDSCTALKEIELPATLRTVGSSAFKSCTGIKKISTKGTLSDYMKIAFGDANANPLTLAKSLYIGGEKLTTLTVPEDCTSIGAYAFYGCADMTSATLGEQVVSIGASGLRACTALREVYLSRNLLSIGNYAFDGCTALTDVYYEGSEEDWALVSIGTNNTLLTGATIHFNQ